MTKMTCGCQDDACSCDHCKNKDCNCGPHSHMHAKAQYGAGDVQTDTPEQPTLSATDIAKVNALFGDMDLTDDKPDADGDLSDEDVQRLRKTFLDKDKDKNKE